MFFINDTVGWIVGDRAEFNTGIFHTINGKNWMKVENPANSYMSAILFINDKEGWSTAFNPAALIHTLDGGNSWALDEQVSIYGFPREIIYVKEKETLYILGNDGLLLKKTNVNSVQEQIVDYARLTVFPNPFSQSAVISWQMNNYRHIALKIYDFMGREIKTLVDEYQAPGEHQVTFNAEGLAAGIYFYQLRANGIVETKKMIILK